MAAVDPGLAGLPAVVLVERASALSVSELEGARLSGLGWKRLWRWSGGQPPGRLVSSGLGKGDGEPEAPVASRARPSSFMPGVGLMVAPNPRIKLGFLDVAGFLLAGCLPTVAEPWLLGGRKAPCRQGTGGPEAGGRPPCIHPPCHPTCLCGSLDCSGAAVVPGWVASPAGAIGLWGIDD